MELHRLSKEFYSLAIVADPPITEWEASFDDGASFVAGEEDDGGFRWLLAGADCADQTGAVAVIGGTVLPLVRDVDNPEIIVRRAPTIRYRN